MNPLTWKEMVERTRELELALGSGLKKVEENERAAYVVQRRSLYFARDMKCGEKIVASDLEALRPAPEGSIPPNRKDLIVGAITRRNYKKGEAVRLRDWLE